MWQDGHLLVWIKYQMDSTACIRGLHMGGACEVVQGLAECSWPVDPQFPTEPAHFLPPPCQGLRQTLHWACLHPAPCLAYGCSHLSGCGLCSSVSLHGFTGCPLSRLLAVSTSCATCLLPALPCALWPPPRTLCSHPTCDRDTLPITGGSTAHPSTQQV